MIAPPIPRLSGLVIDTVHEFMGVFEMATKRAYVAFDFDDIDAKNELLRQSQLPECPFELTDCSIEKPIDKGWPKIAEQRIKGCDCVIVLCGEQTHQAGGVSTEVQFAQAEKKRIICVAISRVGTPTPPKSIAKETPIYTWRWPTLTTLIDGGTPPANAIVRYAP